MGHLGRGRTRRLGVPINAAGGESVVTQSVDPRWHVAVGLAVGMGTPIFAACIFAGALTGTEAHWWA